MAQLKDTTVDGTLSVSGTLDTDGRINAHNGICVDTSTYLQGTCVDGEQVDIAGISTNNSLLYGYGVYNKTGADDSSTYVYGYNDLNLRAKNGDITTNARIVIPNNMGLYGVATDGTPKAISYLSNVDNVALGVYSTSGHTGNTYINAYNGYVYLRNKVGTLAWSAYTGDNYTGIFCPQTDGAPLLGSSGYRWYKVYATTTTIGTSDEREKSDIMSISDYPVTYSRDSEGNVLEQLFDRLEPKTYTLNAESTGEIRIGFVAQDIVSALDELGLSEDDLGLIDHEYWTDKETGEERDRYGLAYTEFIALNTYMIQKQKAKIKEQDERISDLEERLAKLEALVDTK